LNDRHVIRSTFAQPLNGFKGTPDAFANEDVRAGATAA